VVEETHCNSDNWKCLLS